MKKNTLKIIIIAGATLVLAIAIFLIVFFNRNVVVPDVTEISVTEATKLLKKSGFKCKTNLEYSDTILKDIVIFQDKQGGEKAKYGSEITLVVSKGKEQVTLPDVKNCSMADAEKTLKDLGFNVVIEEQFSDTLQKGNVITQSVKSGEQADKGSTITLTISKGPDLVTVPNIEGMLLEKAEETLNNAGLSLKTQIQFSNTVEEGCIISQSTEKNKQVKRNSVVYAKVSAGVANTKGTTPSNANHLGVITTQGNWIYYTGNQDDTIYRMRNDRSEIQRICEAPGVCLNVLGEWLYYVDGNTEGGIYKVKIDGTNKTKISNATSYKMYVENEWIYYTSGYWGGKLYKMKTDGSLVTEIVADTCSEYIVNDGYVYYINKSDGLVYKCTTDGKGKTILCSGFSGGNLSLIGNKLAVSNYDTILTVNFDGSGLKSFKKDKTQYYFLNGYDGWIYYLEHNFNSGTVTSYFGRIKPDGTQKANIYEYTFLNQSNNYMNVANGWIYFKNEHKNNDIYRVNFEGTKIERVG